MKLFERFCRFAVRGPFHMALAWALGWAFVGGLFEAFIDPHGEMLDMWIQTLAIPAFLGGAVFFLLLRLAERRRPYDALSVPRLAGWGLASGPLTGALLVAVTMLIGDTENPLIAAVELIVFATVQGVLSAPASALLFRFARRGQEAAG